MRIGACAVMTCLAVVSLAAAGDFEDRRAENWHQWRGPDATGVAEHATPPITWSETENIRWKVAIDGEGNATPIVWEDKVFVLTAIKTDKIDPSLPKPEDQPERPFNIKFPNMAYQFVVMCLDRATGEEIWRQVAVETIPHEGHHGDNTFASASPITDGERLYAWFGSAGLFCYDLDGNKLWERNFGPVSTRRSFGEGSSPALHDGRLVIVRDQEEQSYIVVVDATNGETLWEKQREEPSAWATPLIVEHGGRTQVVTNATNRVRSYDLENGDLLWECGGQVVNVAPCPVTDGEVVYCMSGYQGSALYALPLDASGDLTGSDKILWSLDQGTPYIPSPLLYDGLLYYNQSNSGTLNCVAAASGETVIPRTRMPGIDNVYASPVGAAGRVYYVGRNGTTLVFERGEEFKVLAENELSEGIDASPALAGSDLFLRGHRHLYCISMD